MLWTCRYAVLWTCRYAATRGDFYTHAMDLAPQLSPFGLSQSRAARSLAAQIDGSDRASWSLPLLTCRSRRGFICAQCASAAR